MQLFRIGFYLEGATEQSVTHPAVRNKAMKGDRVTEEQGYIDGAGLQRDRG